jgi:hypothetical protein
LSNPSETIHVLGLETLVIHFDFLFSAGSRPQKDSFARTWDKAGASRNGEGEMHPFAAALAPVGGNAKAHGNDNKRGNNHGKNRSNDENTFSKKDNNSSTAETSEGKVKVEQIDLPSAHDVIQPISVSVDHLPPPASASAQDRAVSATSISSLSLGDIVSWADEADGIVTPLPTLPVMPHSSSVAAIHHEAVHAAPISAPNEQQGTHASTPASSTDLHLNTPNGSGASPSPSVEVVEVGVAGVALANPPMHSSPSAHDHASSDASSSSIEKQQQASNKIKSWASAVKKASDSSPSNATTTTSAAAVSSASAVPASSGTSSSNNNKEKEKTISIEKATSRNGDEGKKGSSKRKEKGASAAAASASSNGSSTSASTSKQESAQKQQLSPSRPAASSSSAAPTAPVVQASKATPGFSYKAAALAKMQSAPTTTSSVNAPAAVGAPVVPSQHGSVGSSVSHPVDATLDAHGESSAPAAAPPASTTTTSLPLSAALDAAPFVPVAASSSSVLKPTRFNVAAPEFTPRSLVSGSGV